MSSMFQPRRLSFRTPSFSRKRKGSLKYSRVKNSSEADPSSCKDTRDAIVKEETLKVLQEILQNQQVPSLKTYTLHGVTLKVQVLEDTKL